MIKLVASDMDGTLLGPDGRISERTAETVRTLQNQGIRFVVCTGRAYEDAVEPLAERGLICDTICMNGSAVYDQEGLCIEKRELKHALVEFILECSQGEWGDVFFDFMTNHGSYTLTTKEQFAMYTEQGIVQAMSGTVDFVEMFKRFRPVSREELFAEDVEIYKVSVFHPSPFVLERIRENLRGDSHLAVAASHHTNLEITESGAQKGLALVKFAQMQGIRACEIMAIGDSDNDLSMLNLPLGYTVAMGNAMESVKKAARCQTRSNGEDGAAYAMEMLVLSAAAVEQVS